ncbi:Rv3654c family TadE-like protein [Streptosporangium sp. CA-135522]|uniref:Rv3654c family TadE-like protein n=1 Tax=Streptosporangium sp. CA-135522 TaxID=3240072 RepID=UPI003D8A029A
MSRERGGSEAGEPRKPGVREPRKPGGRRPGGVGGRRPGGVGAGESRERDRGSATIWAVGLIALIFAVATAVMFAGAARVARHRVQAAADLSALAAARLAFAAPDRGCAEASSLAESNGARIMRCVVGADGIADVQAVVRLSLPVVGDRAITADARAGPVHIAGPIG